MAENDPAYERYRPRDRHLRASDRDRDAVAAILRSEHVVGRLTRDEFQERLDRSLRAKTYAELDGLVADLPVREPARPRGWWFGLVPVALLPAGLIAAIALSGGRLVWLAFPLGFFVIRRLLWRHRMGAGDWGPGGGVGYRRRAGQV